MTAFKILAFFGGVGLFAWLVHGSDLAMVTALVSHLGEAGVAAIITAFTVGFVADVLSWLLMFRTVPARFIWAARLWLVQMIGEALNVVMPFGSFSGEPVKALLLKRHYGVAYAESSTSLLLIQTVNSLAQVPFLLTAVVLLVSRHLIAPALEHVILGAAIVISAFMVLVLAALHLRALNALHKRLERSRWGQSLDSALRVMEDIEGRLFFFLRATPRRFAACYILAFSNWMMGAVEMWLIFHFLGVPLSFAECWMVEGVVTIARSVSFFVPAHLGVQDGAITLLGQALTGSADIGVAVALVRRARELTWSAVGLLIGGWFGLKKPVETLSAELGVSLENAAANEAA